MPSRPRIVSVLLPQPLPEPFDYELPETLNAGPGSFVTVSLGPREVTGVVWAERATPSNRKLKPVQVVIGAPGLSANMRSFIERAAKYICAPSGMVLAMAMRSREALDEPPVETLVVRTGDTPPRMTPAREQALAQATEPMSGAELARKAGVSPGVVKGLLEAGALMHVERSLDPPFPLPDPDLPAKQLTGEQAETSAYLRGMVREATFRAALLDGVTGSGKTEVYFEAIAEALQDPEAQVLVLLPEIALTQAVTSRFEDRFGVAPAEWHSAAGSSARRRVWREVAAGRARIVVGARSALFLPFAKLRLIIVDEEHEQTFKQVDPAPRYHARDASIVLANSHKAKVLLGSATPSIETYFNSQSGKYGLVEIAKRYGDVKMPAIELVDLKDKYFRKQVTGHFSDTLIEEITAALSLGEQVILFQNRRGFSPIIECLTCGHVPQCPQCDVSLTYHKHKNQLRCHYCGYAMAKPTNCHNCSSVHLTTKGFGTEQIQQELVQLFPNAKVGRMDQDTTRGKFGFEKIIDSFKNQEVEILVGTQMLAKGLDFDNVSLVGIMNADNMLYHPDFRAFERSYQMMTQVSGRSGRSEKQGKVIIQTYNPDHNTIQQVVHNNYIGMYKEQLYERQIYKYPPYFKLIKLTLKHRDFDKLKEGSMWLYQVLQQNFTIPVLGPEEPPISRIRNEYIRTIMIKIPTNQSLQGTKKTIQKILNSFDVVAQYRAIKVAVNVDFY